MSNIKTVAEATVAGMSHAKRVQTFFSPSHSGTDLEYILQSLGMSEDGPSLGTATQREEWRNVELVTKYLTKYDIAEVEARMEDHEESLTLALVNASSWTTEILDIKKKGSSVDRSAKTVYYKTITFEVHYRYP